MLSSQELDDLLGPPVLPGVVAASPAVSGRASAPAGDMALVGSAYDGAERLDRLRNWTPIVAPVNSEIVPEKPIMDARSRDLARNDGGVAGAVALTKDIIVGQQFLLNAKPDSRLLFGAEDETWEGEFQEEVEAKFALWADSPNNWPDAQRINGLTGLVRLAIGSFNLTGEVLAAAEWMPDDGRPFRSAVLMLDPDRLSNPDFNNYAPNIVGGVERDRRGAPIAYHILDHHPYDWAKRGYPGLHWRRVMARKPNWGRPNVLHVFEQQRPDQARGISPMVAALGEIKMLREFRKVELQRAVVAATYAATLESDLPTGDAYTMMGAEERNPSLEWTAQYLEESLKYAAGGTSLKMDGVKIPVLMPGTNLKIQSPGATSPLGADFETSMLRHIAGALGVSYEELSRDFSKTNYSSGRAAMGQTDRHLAGRKKLVADRTASFVYRLWLEEAINAREIEALKHRRAPSFYAGLNADAYSACEWIGAGRGQVDEMKETQAAMLRLRGHISTQEIEIARIHGTDWRRVLKQIAREKALHEKLDLVSVYDAEATDAENAASGEPREPAE